MGKFKKEQKGKVKKNIKRIKNNKSNNRFIKLWLPIKKAVWIYQGIIDFSTLPIPQSKYLREQLEKILPKATANNNPSGKKTTQFDSSIDLGKPKKIQICGRGKFTNVHLSGYLYSCRKTATLAE